MSLDSILHQSAQYHAEDMATQNYFDHTSLDGSSFAERVARFGATNGYLGENIAWGQKTPEAVMKARMNSPGHKANILNVNFTLLGVGFSETGNYWVQNFGG